MPYYLSADSTEGQMIVGRGADRATIIVTGINLLSEMCAVIFLSFTWHDSAKMVLYLFFISLLNSIHELQGGEVGYNQLHLYN